MMLEVVRRMSAHVNGLRECIKTLADVVPALSKDLAPLEVSLGRMKALIVVLEAVSGGADERSGAPAG